MDLGSIFLILGLLILVAMFVSRPLFENKATLVTQEEHEFSHLLAERDRILNSLQELDFDFTLGKIPELEYPSQRASLLQAGAQVLRSLDEYQAAPAAGDLEDRIEAAIAARRIDSGHQFEPAGVGANNSAQRRMSTPDDDLEVMIANRRRGRNGKSAGFCPKCGSPVQKSDHFCPRCGETLV